MVEKPCALEGVLAVPAQAVLLNTWNCLECERVGNQFLCHLAWESKLGQAVSWQSTFIAHRSGRVSKVCNSCQVDWGSIQPRLGVGKAMSSNDTALLPDVLICIVIQFNSWCKNHVPWRVSWLSQPRQCCLTHEAVWSVGGLVTSFSLS